MTSAITTATSTAPGLLATLGLAVLLTACTGGGSDAGPAPASTSESSQTNGRTGEVSEAAKGASCEQYRDLSAQVEAATAEAQGVTVNSVEDGEKVTELMTKVSDLTEKADAAYALCYAEGAQPGQ